jgi:hypothetical protein
MTPLLLDDGTPVKVDPTMRICPACGAKPGKPCLTIESKESAMQPELMGVLYRNEGEMHEARRSK